MKKLVFILAFLNTLSFVAQNTKLNKSISAEFGYGQLLKREWGLNRLGNESDRFVPYYGLNYDLNYPIINKKLYVQSGAGYKLFKTALDYKNENNEEIKISYYNNSIELPLQLKYYFEDNITINAGVTNSMLLDKNSTDFYSLMFKAGLNFKINDKINIGTNYYRDITPTFSDKNLNIDFIAQRFGLSIMFDIQNH